MQLLRVHEKFNELKFRSQQEKTCHFFNQSNFVLSKMIWWVNLLNNQEQSLIINRINVVVKVCSRQFLLVTTMCCCWSHFRTPLRHWPDFASAAANDQTVSAQTLASMVGPTFRTFFRSFGHSRPCSLRSPIVAHQWDVNFRKPRKNDWKSQQTAWSRATVIAPNWQDERSWSPPENGL